MHATLILAASVLGLTLGGCGSLRAGHERHAPSTSEASTSCPAGDHSMARMHAMHEKMQAAKTPQERAALMDEHMQAMHDGMASMGRMRGGMGMMGGGGPDAQRAMPCRMDMMESMMQMMVDREAARQQTPR